MAVQKNDKHKQYARFAMHCLEMVGVARDQESGSIHREMAAEWVRLADAVRRSKNPGISPSDTGRL